MANTKGPRGLYSPLLITGGAPHTETFKVSSAYASDFHPGQPFIQLTTGFVRHQLVTNSKSTAGVCMSFLPNPNGQTARPDGTKDQDIQGISDLWNTEWEIQLSHASGGLALVGTNVAFFDMTGVDTTRRQSKIMAVNPQTTEAPLRTLGFPKDVDNDFENANPRIRVRFNEAFIFRGITTGI